MLADEPPGHNAVAPGPDGPQGVSLHLYVDDADGVMRAATAAGSRVLSAVETKFYGDRLGTFIDPFGHVWHVSTYVEDVPEDELRRRAQAAAGSG